MSKDKCEGVWQLLSNLMSDGDVAAIEPATKRAKCSAAIFDIESESDSDDVDEQHSPVTLELNLYKSMPCNPDLDDPLNFWKINERSYPRLSKVAKQHLNVPATSVPVERLFSSAGEILSKNHSSLPPKNANMLLCLHSWLKE